MHHHGGGEGINIASLLGLNQHHHNGFIAHLLGLDHNVHHGHSQMGHAPIGNPAQMPFWAAALQALKPSTFFQGINISANFWLAVMFLGFIGWLFVVYWIRHHEPFSNAVLGTGAAQSATANYDRRMMAEIRDAIPINNSAQGETIYVPDPGSFAQLPPGGTANATPPSAIYPADTAMSNSSIVPQAAMMPVNANAAPAAMPLTPMPQMSAPSAFYGSPPVMMNGAAPMVNVPIYAQSGTKIRTLVAR
jgi:hypothetical protein